ncbi:protein PRRC1-B-like [Portunus trituberculatus]|uniref:protein PRRC1-B-like n=1 Tax=Portunus trituberculatus TaxID=210409 RepID=UPI001E1D11C0|nr:protein PRRC1-B-like [Portunus trituberculatus]
MGAFVRKKIITFCCKNRSQLGSRAAATAATSHAIGSRTHGCLELTPPAPPIMLQAQAACPVLSQCTFVSGHDHTTPTSTTFTSTPTSTPINTSIDTYISPSFLMPTPTSTPTSIPHPPIHTSTDIYISPSSLMPTSVYRLGANSQVYASSPKIPTAPTASTAPPAPQPPVSQPRVILKATSALANDLGHLLDHLRISASLDTLENSGQEFLSNLLRYS